MSSDSESEAGSFSEGSYKIEQDFADIEYGELSYSEKGLRWQLQTVNPDFTEVYSSSVRAQHRIVVDQVVKSLLRRICKTAFYRVLIFAVAVFIFYFIYLSLKTNLQRVTSNEVYEVNSQPSVMPRQPSVEPQSASASETGVRKTYIILAWNMPSTVHRPEVLEGKCGTCIVTSDRNKANQSDAIVIHYGNMNTMPDIRTRNPRQIYVWLCRETPRSTKFYHKKLFREFDYIFNATMTYRRDSEIYYPYAESWTRTKTNKRNTSVTFLENDVDEVLAQKRHLAAWVVSNCYSTKGAKERFWYVNRLLKAGLKADLFGRCFRNNPFPPYRSDEAAKKLSQYKFYLAFENSHHCRDYVTEKFWYNSLYSGAVPIVWGPSREDMKQLAPPNSYIHAEDFQSDEELVKYINYLDKNYDAYKQYFKWRKLLLKDFNLQNDTGNGLSASPVFSSNGSFGFCAICSALHSSRASRFRPIPSLNAWWYGSENEECLN